MTLVLARGLHEQGDLDAVGDLELVEGSGDMVLPLLIGTWRITRREVAA